MLNLFHNQGKGQPIGGGSYIQKVLNTQLGDLIGYWPMNESSGSVSFDKSLKGNNGAYTGVTLGELGIGDGLTCPYFDGTNDYVDIYSAALNSDFDGDHGTLALWAKVNGAGVWTDGTGRVGANLGGTDERIYIGRTAANNVLSWYRRAGGVTDQITFGGHSDTDWMHLAITWNTTSDELKAYKNGSQAGSTQSTLGTWATALTENLTNIGSQSEGPGNPWHGWLAHVAIWKTPLLAAQISQLAVL